MSVAHIINRKHREVSGQGSCQGSLGWLGAVENRLAPHWLQYSGELAPLLTKASLVVEMWVNWPQSLSVGELDLVS